MCIAFVSNSVLVSSLRGTSPHLLAAVTQCGLQMHSHSKLFSVAFPPAVINTVRYLYFKEIT